MSNLRRLLWIAAAITAALPLATSLGQQTIGGPLRSDAVAAHGRSVLDRLSRLINAISQKTASGLHVRTKLDSEGKVTTKEEFKVPLTITARVKTDRNNIRLFYGDRGVVIIGWEMRPSELRHADPVTGSISGVPGAGEAKVDTWTTVEWTISDNQSRVVVNGVERASFNGNYSGFSGVVGVGTHKSSIVVSSLEVREGVTTPPPSKSPPDARPDPASDKKDVISIDVTVPTSPPENGSEPVTTTTAKADDPYAIERPQYRAKAKSFDKIISSVTSMVVRVGEDGDQMGFTSDIIATVNPSSRGGDTAGAGFFRADGDEMMKTSFQEAVRAVTLRYPFWKPGHIDFSFGEKFTSHGGPSAGTAFALLMLATLENFELDPKCAVTGDITVNWKVRQVGGVTAKLRGATLDKCQLAVIPADNKAAFADMALLYGLPSIYRIQVFSIDTLHDAVAVARSDRGPKIVEAIKLFGELQAQLAADEKATLQKPETGKTLRRILELTPNHLSARNLLDRYQGQAPKTLSSNGTYYRLSVIFYPFVHLLFGDDAISRDTLPTQVTAVARKRIVELRAIASPELLPLIKETALTIDATDGFANKQISANALKARWQKLSAQYATTFGDRTFVEKLVREGF